MELAEPRKDCLEKTHEKSVDAFLKLLKGVGVGIAKNTFLRNAWLLKSKSKFMSLPPQAMEEQLQAARDEGDRQRLEGDMSRGKLLASDSQVQLINNVGSEVP